MKRVISLLIAFFLSNLVIAAASSSTIMADDIVIVGIGNSEITNITLDSTPEGLSGYNISISLSESSVATIASVAFPSWATLHSNSPLPASSVWLKAADINKQVEAGATDVLLATLTLESQKIGDSFINISINRLDNDNGYPIATALQNATITVAEDEETPPAPPPPPPPPPGDGNDPPTADANGPYYEIEDVPLAFDGSESTDDGTIKTYEWDFGDGNTGTGVTPSYTYTNPGNYTVDLTVTDDGGKKDTDTTYAIITGKPNLPPDKPELYGTTIGHKDTGYNYTAVSTDPDNDTIRYIFDWGDGTNKTISPFLASGETFNVTHNWKSAGVYTVNVSAEDYNNATSGNRSLVVLIDTYFVGDIGYFIDDNSDGTYDSFYCNETGTENLFELQENGEYKIDSNGDGEYDCTYNPVTGAITSLKGKETTETPEVLWIMIVGIVIVIAIIAFIILLHKKK